MPTAQGGFNFFVDAVADGLYNFCLDHIALGVDGDLNDHVTGQILWQFRAIDWRIGVYDWISDVHFMAGNRPIHYRTERRPGLRVQAGLYGPRFGRAMLGRWFWFSLLRMRPCFGLLFRRRQSQLRFIGGIILVSRGQVSEVVGVSRISVGKPCWTEFDGRGIMEHDPGQDRQMGSDGRSYSSASAKPGATAGNLRLQSGKHIYTLLPFIDAKTGKRLRKCDRGRIYAI